MQKLVILQRKRIAKNKELSSLARTSRTSAERKQLKINMNKLVIVGNGFDLAHDLPTSYKHFINNFWKSLKDNYKDKVCSRIVEIDSAYNGFLQYGQTTTESYTDFVKNMIAYAEDNGGSFNVERQILNSPGGPFNTREIFKFNNFLFKIITIESVENWVDIENIYYEILKSIVKKDAPKVYDYPRSIERLNQEFEDVKILLERYIRVEIINKHDFSKEPINLDNILRYFRIDPLYLDVHKEHGIFNEFNSADHDDLRKLDKRVVELFLDNSIPIGADVDWPQTLFLDFNYTFTGSAYASFINSRNEREYGTARHIQIHGRINSNENKVNFGFGDEMDDDYKGIENTGNNAYLKYIKSFQYLHTSNYRKLLNWIESNKFQVYIFGHSCGLSDRTLLNAIFENQNCRSIKIFYHEPENGKDNYTELTQNISRHFNKKALMRTKIVDKTSCVKLDQSVRFREKK
ncbi:MULTISPECIES: AbiH family protein [unclassified Flavobacterium]|uniref:AbiH family protein n=1 Tax=unclassified Flavobacterium TaxID=196869 RepID=UPI001F13D8F3|nr:MULTISPECIES: AbiH family protein [unclassified Flavobacterium]UMY64668.1 bacteriophage abortive infection AbiH family protein [Flavobacterium sp. HJ-32-4]